MATKAQIAAYERRLLKIVDKGAHALTSECVAAVATVGGVTPAGGWVEEATGTLISFTHRQGYGLFGAALVTDVVLCTECAFQLGGCADEHQIHLQNVVLRGLQRNTRAAGDVAACRVCGCTDDRACLTEEGPCRWVEADLCSNPECVGAASRPVEEPEEVDLVAALRGAVEAAKSRRKEAGRG